MSVQTQKNESKWIATMFISSFVFLILTILGHYYYLKSSQPGFTVKDFFTLDVFFKILGNVSCIVTILSAFLAIQIFKIGQHSSEQSNDIVRDVGKVVSDVQDVVKNVQDALRIQLSGLEHIFPSIKTFLKEIEIDQEDNDYKFYLMSDTIAIGQIHKCNPVLREKYPKLDKELLDITSLIATKATQSKECYICTLRHNEVYNKDSRLIKKFILPIYAKLTDTKIESLNENFAITQPYIHNLLAMHKTELERFNTLRCGKQYQHTPLVHLPFQMFIIKSESERVYKAFLIFIGSYNMEKVQNAEAMITNDKNFVENLISMFESIAEESNNINSKV